MGETINKKYSEMNLDELGDVLVSWMGTYKFTKSYTKEKCMFLDYQRNTLIVHLYTYNNDYKIRVYIRPNKDPFIGCVVNSRKPRAGESWPRGSDLPDGFFNESTWNDIMNKIVGYELIDIQSPVKKLYIDRWRNEDYLEEINKTELGKGNLSSDLMSNETSIHEAVVKNLLYDKQTH